MTHHTFCPHLTFRLSFRYDDQQEEENPFQLTRTSPSSSRKEKEMKTNNIPAFLQENQGSGDDRVIVEPPTQIQMTDETGIL